LVQTELLMLPRSIFQELLLEPEACRHLMNRMAAVCCDSWTQIEVMGCSLVSDKIRVALSWLCSRIGEPTPEGIRIEMSQGRLAQIVGTTRESLNRNLGLLKARGIISTKAPRGRNSSFVVKRPDLLDEANALL
jgi:CRP-like cAMP-binding protein